ncbi:MAG: hypothetical protein KatS3mg028_1534 [Bacteroidia bacterium]|nr:MAG: hypothetical protein KatS3mg028_1534 [Bacteroidia bacterium]GIV33252.1 MAG: hypothetical protein KatS3mg031_0787 [Chitinophagales bacterium]
MAKKENWGGSWTEEKLEAFEKYVEAYLTIMHSTREKYNGWPKEIIYFDGFAGSGSRMENDNDQMSMQSIFKDLDIQKEEAEVYQGSSERVLSLTKKFDKYYFVDLDNSALHNLKQKLLEKNLINRSCFFLTGDVNEVICEFLSQWNKDKVALVLLDPYGMQVKWSTIQKMKDKRIDLWILVPSGVIINRLIDRNGNLKNIEKLQEYLGMSKEEIMQKFYQKKASQSLFGEIEITEKKKNTIHVIAETYVEKLKKIFKYVTEKPLELKNSKKVIIYHFIFASNNKSAKKIAGQIIELKIKK